MLGTASYISPEQAIRRGRPRRSSDVYALGVVAYQCLSGRRPFEGDNPLEIAMRHVREHRPAAAADIPPPVRAIVERAMAKDPAARWPTAAALAAVARQAAATLAGQAVSRRRARSPPAGRRHRTPAGVAPPSSPAMAPGAHPRRHPHRPAARRPPVQRPASRTRTVRHSGHGDSGAAGSPIGPATRERGRRPAAPPGARRMRSPGDAGRRVRRRHGGADRLLIMLAVVLACWSCSVPG